MLVTILLRKVLPILLILALAGHAAYRVYDHGRQAERAVWELKEAKQLARYQKELDAERVKRQQQSEEHQTTLAKMENDRDAETKKLNDDIHALSNRGLFISAKRCTPSDTGLPKAKDTSAPGSGADRVRLSEEDERRLISLAADANRVVAQYNSCRVTLKSLAEVVR